mmetsp:Transcript_100081/g.261008  ORF Transcript_100081/g.261008 Transcript_100081/m.261008 type:complete len:300 (+) Transcript_100081:206-1105(+)
MTLAAPMPVPMHIETTPSFPLVRFSSGSSVAIRREPVQPRGWPRAMAPPLGFTFSIGIFKCSMVMVACEAKASLISKMSTSATLAPAFSSAAGMANAGPIPMTRGSTPTTAKLRIRATMGRPIFFAADRRASRTREAPSETWLEFPAVVVPPTLNAGFRLLSPSKVVPARGPSSAFTVTTVSTPDLSFTLVVTGTISRSNRPAFWAASALLCDSTASMFCLSLEMFHFSATFSEVMPIGTMQAMARSLSAIAFENFEGSTLVAMLYMLIDSTPPASPTSITPALMLAAMLATACRPLLH